MDIQELETQIVVETAKAVGNGSYQANIPLLNGAYVEVNVEAAGGDAYTASWELFDLEDQSILTGEKPVLFVEGAF